VLVAALTGPKLHARYVIMPFLIGEVGNCVLARVLQSELTPDCTV
jgi:hypothetical protein